ncbi:protein S100-P-like [Phyllobates terribilis]|uniref:protein S100-P-like n=1 Tax=Phyllobates terribilis TaxID=111132 RepID=UPI003CCB4CF7
MTQLEVAILSIHDVFDKYSSTEGNKNTLTKEGMKTLLEKELPGIMVNAKEKNNSKKLLNDLDKNGDTELTFKEFVNLLSEVLIDRS